ncbi:MAG TPA: DUF1566 domain-containing protein [Euryarchaeota archaeon]|nr:DUF1566 domain-containing protein [Euryarchaeota archaeon]
MNQKGVIGLLFGIFMTILPALTLAGTVELPQTGQTKCYSDLFVSKIDCAGTGQDGEIQAGVEWPSLRFTDNGDGTITDNLTGLMWLKDGNCFGTQTSQGALDAVADFKTNPGKYYCQDYTATYNDWRLPNVNELESLIHAGKNTYAWLNNQAFANVKSSGYWTSTYVYGYGAAFIDMEYGNVYYWYGEDVLPVRGTTTTLPKTGQTKCYNYTGLKTNCAGTGQDGEIQAGITWPAPRFTDKGDGTVTDNLTGLMWLKDAGCLGGRQWFDALDRVADFNTDPGKYNCVNYHTASYSDWRLPNRKELFSLIDFSRPGLPSGDPFVNVEGDYYWSSTADGCGYFTCSAWRVDMGNGIVYSHDMSNYSNVWPVRAGLPSTSVMPLPTNQRSWTYPSTAFSIMSTDPAEAKPIGVGSVAEGGDTLSIQIGLNQISGPVDIYLAIYAPEVDPDNIYLITSDTIQPLSEGLVPWKANTTGPIDDTLFGNIPISGLPLGTYNLYLAVTPAGTMDSYYLWATYFVIP